MHVFWFQHKYDIVSCKPLTARQRIILTGEILDAFPVTNIVMRCNCSKIKEKVLRGHFTMEELKGGKAG